MFLKVVSKKRETDNCFSLIFEKPKGFNFYPGQYLDYELSGDTRAFTISSSPTEDFLMLTTKKGLSEFKKALAKLEPGDTVTTSHPAGTFILDESSPAVFIAGGIGITPFRSMIKYVVDQKLTTPITLIHSNSDHNFLFKEEIEEWKQKMPNLNLIYHNSITSGHLNHKSLIINHESIYYLAGSHSFINAIEKILLKLDVDETNIRCDHFDGY